MDRNRAFTKIEYILFSIENRDKTHTERMVQVLDVLEELENYSFSWGKRQGMFKSVNLLTDLAEKENKTEN